MKISRLVYIHGFNSSPNSMKAKQFGEFLEQNYPDIEYVVPELNHEPLETFFRLENIIDESTGLLGSSLGGFWATYFSQIKGLPAVVINPAVAPHRLFKDFLGPQYNPYQDYHYQVEPRHIEQLQLFHLTQLKQPDLIWLLQQTADEVLHFQDAVDYYQACLQTIEFGGDHSFQGFESHFKNISPFFNLASN